MIKSQETTRLYVHHTWMGHASWTCTRHVKNIQSFLWVKHPPGRSSTVQLFLSRTNSQQSPLMKELALGEPNECLSFMDKENSHLIHLTSRAGVIRYPHICTPTYSGFLYSAEFILFPHGRSSDSAHRCLLLPSGRADRSHSNSDVFYCRQEWATEDLDGSACLFWPWRFPRTQPWESCVPFPALPRPHCVPLPSLVKVKTKPAQTLHCWVGNMYWQLEVFNKRDLFVSWQDVEAGGSYRSLSCFRGVSWTFSGVPRQCALGFFPWCSCNALGLIHLVCTGSLWGLLWEQLSSWSRDTSPARSLE